jgi:DNA-binding cell septation regulator SpoVG
MEITDLSIYPYTNLSPLIAQCSATIDHAINLKNITIRQAKKGIYVLFPKSISFATSDIKKQFSSRILATYVINYAMDREAA